MTKLALSLALLTTFTFAPIVYSAPVKLSGEAVKFDSIESNFTGLLREIAKERPLSLETSGKNAEAWLWKDGNYTPQKATLLRSSLIGALNEAGYSVKDYDSAAFSTNLFTYFPNDVGGEFEPDIWKVPFYFTAINQKNGKAYLGTLIQSKDAMALGPLPIKVRVPQAQPTLPSASSGGWLVKDGKDAMKGVTPPKPPTFAANNRVAYFARGQVKNVAGKPIAGASITVQSGIIGGFVTLHRGQTDHNGFYNIKLSSGLSRVSSAFATINFAGKNYGLPLHPADGNSEQFDSKRGHIENFTLKTWGQTNPQAANDPANLKLYYGGALRLSWRSELESGGTIEVTLKPEGLLLDGSVGRTFIYCFSAEGYEAPLNNIPLGRYKLSAKLIQDGDSAPLRVALFPSEQLSGSVPVVFEPVSATTPDFGYSGTRPRLISIRP